MAFSLHTVSKLFFFHNWSIATKEKEEKSICFSSEVEQEEGNWQSGSMWSMRQEKYFLVLLDFYCSIATNLANKTSHTEILLNEEMLKTSNLISDKLRFIREIQKLGFLKDANDCIQCVVGGSRLAQPK